MLQRAQGRGTFVRQNYLDQKHSPASLLTVGLVFNPHVSLADFYHGQILEGIRQAAQESHANLRLLRFGEEGRFECNGFLYVNPLPNDLHSVSADSRRVPAVVVGSLRAKSPKHIDVDNIELAQNAVEHLASSVTGGSCTSAGTTTSVTRATAGSDISRLARRRHRVLPSQVIRVPRLWLDDKHIELLELGLNDAKKPTAIFAAGYTLGCRFTVRLRRVGCACSDALVSDWGGRSNQCAHLWPPLTTMRQPLVELGREALKMLMQKINRGAKSVESRLLHAELVLRESTAPPAA